MPVARIRAALSKLQDAVTDLECVWRERETERHNGDEHLSTWDVVASIPYEQQHRGS